MNFVNSNLKIFGIVFVSSLILLVLLSIFGQVLELLVSDPRTILSLGFYFKVFYLGIFAFSAFSAVPLIMLGFIKYFGFLQRYGGGDRHWLAEWLVNNQQSIISFWSYSLWSIMAIGLIVGTVWALREGWF